MSKKSKNLPQLRFSEFEGSWKKSSLSSLLEKVIDYRGKPPPKSDDGIVLITARNVKQGFLDFTSKEFIASEDYDSWMNRGIPQKGDVLFTTEAPLGNVCIFPEGGVYALGQRTLTLRTKSSLSNGEFLFYILQSPKIREEIFSQSTGSTAKGIKSSIFKEIPLEVPSIAEQEKIASFLGAIDTRLTQLRRKHELLQTYKRGVMQKIFSQEIRFKGDRRKPFPDWNAGSFYDCLDEIVDFRGRTPVKLGMEWGGGNILSLSANNVKNGYIDFQAECNLASEELHEKWMSGIDVRKDDIIFTMEAPLGNATLIPDSQKYILSQRVVLFKTSKNINNRFLLQLIWSPFFQESLKSLSTGTTAKGINQKSLKKINIHYPTIGEQEKISDFLLAIDKKIEAISQQINLTAQFKKGLLQKMFV